MTASVSEVRFRVKQYYRPSDRPVPHHGAMKTVGARIRQLREERELTQPQLAKAAEVAQSSLSEIETGQSKHPSALTLVKLAKYFEVDPEWLLTGKGPKSPVATFTSEEAELLLLFRAVSPEAQAYLVSRARMAYEDEHRRPGPAPDLGPRPDKPPKH